MSGSVERAWRCSVCGYVHRGPTPPASCPMCGAPGSEFQPFDGLGASDTAAAAAWRCINCGYVHRGREPPEACPVCHASADQFEPLGPAGARPPVTSAAFSAVVVGGGIAGVSAAEAIRSAAPAAEITLISAEEPQPYFRLNLTRLLAGEIDSPALPLHPPDWYGSNRVSLLTGATVESLDLGGKAVLLAGGLDIAFDRLILATGAHPFVPPIPGADREGVVTLRTAADAECILAAALRGDPVVVIGGGVLGLETAGALARRGADVALLEGHEWLMPRQLDRSAGEILGAHVERTGIRLVRAAKTSAIAGSARAERVELADGRVLPAALVVLATGVRPNTHLARRAGLEVDQGIVVSNRMQTSHSDVWAAGDAAEHNGILYGTWAASLEQGTVAGLAASGADATFSGQPRSNTLKVLGIELTSIGQFEPVDGSYVAVSERSDRRYLHFVFRHGLLVGTILLGDASLAGSARAAIDGKTDWSDLLRGAPSAAVVAARLEESALGSRRSDRA
jgi:nitrite reductase (NADH) large subunit